MNQKENLIVLVVVVVIILIGLSSYLVFNKQSSENINYFQVSTTSPDKIVSPIDKKPVTTEPIGSTNVPYLKDGTCPSGYVDYGVPLQCVTLKYMEYCKTNTCPQ